MRQEGWGETAQVSPAAALGGWGQGTRASHRAGSVQIWLLMLAVPRRGFQYCLLSPAQVFEGVWVVRATPTGVPRNFLGHGRNPGGSDLGPAKRWDWELLCCRGMCVEMPPLPLAASVQFCLSGPSQDRRDTAWQCYLSSLLKCALGPGNARKV